MMSLTTQDPPPLRQVAPDVPEDLARVQETPIGELTLGQMIETFVIWHINAHCGEIPGLQGCMSAKGYPF